MDSVTIFHVLEKVKGIGRKTLNGITLKTIEELRDIEDIYDLYEQIKSKNVRIGQCSKDEFERYLEDVSTTLAKSKDSGIITISKFDESFPAKLRNISSPPVVVNIKGNIECLYDNAITIIGTRNISEYGHKIGLRIGKIIAEEGFVVVSGLAEGCDSAAHMGCIDAGRPTVAVMAMGLDTVYPKSNRQLAELILEKGGCLLSEYPIGAAINRYNFIDRDRLQTGLSLGVLVIETGVKGGSLHAINAALKDKKPLGCFDYDEQHYLKYENSRGNREFIRKQLAMAIKDKESILGFIRKCVHLEWENLTLF